MDLDIWTSDVGLGNQVLDYAVGTYDVEYTCWQDEYVNYVTGWENMPRPHGPRPRHVQLNARRTPG